MKIKKIALVILMGCLCSVLCAQHRMVGTWQLCAPVKISDHDYQYRSMPFFKVVREDGTFMQIRMSSRGYYEMSHYGKYKINGRVYTEYVEKHNFDPKWTGRTNAIPFSFVDEDLLDLSFSRSASSVSTEEYWKRMHVVDNSLRNFIRHH